MVAAATLLLNNHKRIEEAVAISNQNLSESEPARSTILGIRNLTFDDELQLGLGTQANRNERSLPRSCSALARYAPWTIRIRNSCVSSFELDRVAQDGSHRSFLHAHSGGPSGAGGFPSFPGIGIVAGGYSADRGSWLEGDVPRVDPDDLI